MRVRRDRNRSRHCSGAVAVELAFVLPIFITLAFAQIESARLCQVVQLLTTAARQGARVAVIPGKAQADVQTAVNTVLSSAGITVGTVNPTPTTWQTDPGGTLITVSISIPYSQVAWMSPSMFFGSTVLTGSATLSSERP